jgi:Apea-like HEPN/ApeA N-terminal domain 1
MNEIEILELSKSYSFHVRVQDRGNRFVGKLELTSEKIVLTVTGESKEGRDWSHSFGDVEQMACDDYTRTYLLYGLKSMQGKSGSLGHGDIGYFEHVYEISYLVYSTGILSENETFSGFSVRFRELKNWLGHTEKQEEILNRYYKAQLFNRSDVDLEEFSVAVHNKGTVAISYYLSAHYSAHDFSTGLQFPPSLIMHFSHEQSATETKQIFDDLCEITSFAIGRGLSLENAQLFCSSRTSSSQNTWLYFPKNKEHKEQRKDYILFPLGRNLRFNDLGYPEFDIGLFNTYFSLSDKDREKWKKYHKYRRMESAEERFLGYFRLLESLTFKSKNFLDEDKLQGLIDQFETCLGKRFGDKKSVKSFLRGLNRYNRSKYNTEKCLLDFYDNIPSEVSKEWQVEKSDIKLICTLRNDISHANDFDVSEDELHKFTKFIETLLVFALFLKLGISTATVSTIISRMEGYHLIASNRLENICGRSGSS